MNSMALKKSNQKKAAHVQRKGSVKTPPVPLLPKAYVIGDAGEDELEHGGQTYLIPSGAFFIETALREFTESVLDVVPINSSDAKGATVQVDSLPQKTWTLQEYEDPPLPGETKTQRVVRLAKYEICAKKVPKIGLNPPKQPDSHSLLIAHHAGDRWLGSRQADACDDFIAAFLKSDAEWLPPGMPRVLVNLSAKLPERNFKSAAQLDRPFTSALWNNLFDHRERVAIVLSLSALRAEGGTVSKRLSWEQNVEDIAAELHLFPPLKALAQFRHLFVRCGTVAVIHIENDARSPLSNKLSGRLYFTPYANGVIHRSNELYGGFLGRNTILICALARAIALASRGQNAAELEEKERHSSAFHEKLRNRRNDVLFDAIGRGLRAMRAVDDEGYGEALNSVESGPNLVARHMEIAHKHFKDPLNAEPGCQDTVSWRPIPEYLLHTPLPNALRSTHRWHILDDVLLEAPVHRVNVAMAIVKVGHQKVLNRLWSRQISGEIDQEVWDTLTRIEYLNPKDRASDFVTLEDGDLPATPEWPGGKLPTTPKLIGNVEGGFTLDVPVTSFSFLTLVERDEIEEFRGISNLLRSYRSRAEAQQRDHRKPLEPISIAVFGPPGSGKSFGVKQIADAIDNKAIPLLEFNVSQFRGPRDLETAFKRVASTRDKLLAEASKAGIQAFITPLVFFDEFDCPADGQRLGWLKYFLAPMQDGKFGKLADLGPAILVFAGGIFHTFEGFDPTTDSAYENLRDSPEYKSRLQAFAEQKGPDFTSRLRGHINILGINDAPGRAKHFIRRAVQLRGALQKASLLTSSEQANVDDAVIYALLTVDRYRHGVRSMQAIIEMCSPNRGRLEIASLPSRSQLEMHVDADEFMIRVSRGRARAQPEWNS